MSSLLPMPVAPAPPAANGPPPRAGGRPSQPDGDPFSSVLEQQARTATAEGLSKHQDANDASSPSVSPDNSAQQTVEVAQPAADGTDPAAVAAAIADFLGVPLSTPETPTPGAAGQSPAGATPGAALTGPAQAQPVVPATPAGPIAAEAASVPAPTAQPAGPAPATTAASLESDVAATPAVAPATDADGAPVQQPVAATADAAAATPDGAAGRHGAGQQQTPSRDPRAAAAAATTLPGTSPATPDAPTAATASNGAAAPSQPAAATGNAAAQAAPTSQPATPPAAPAATQPVGAPIGTEAPSAAEPARGAVTLDRAVETVRLAMRAGAERGVTHARIALSPAELGGIEIHLRHTVDGIIARVVADATGAAQLLQQSASDLRRQLEQQGVNVLRLDVAASGEEQRRAGAQSGFGESGGRDSAGTAHGDETIVVGTTAATSTERVELPNGALVDVLA